LAEAGVDASAKLKARLAASTTLKNWRMLTMVFSSRILLRGASQ